MTPRTHAIATLAGLSMLALAAGRAEAASQILGLVASNGMPTPLTCTDGQCSGLVGSFCLQFSRPTPDADSEYRLAPGGGITILARRADGSAVRLAAADLVAIRSRAGFSSVAVSLPEAELKGMGAVGASIEVAPLTSVLPVAVAGDFDPETPADIAYATGSERRLAQSTFENGSEISDAARLVTFVIGSLPQGEPADRAGREAVWNNAAAVAQSSLLDPQGVAAASRIYESCATASALGRCMEEARQELMSTLALEFEFRAEGAGRGPVAGAGGS